MGLAIFDTVSFAMRYWFIIITLGIVAAVAYVSYKEYKYKKSMMEQIDSYAGYIEIVDGYEDFIGDKFGITDGCIIGSGVDCEIIIPGESIRKYHAKIFVQEDILLQPIDKASTLINGRKAINAFPLKTGDKFTTGDITFRIFIKKKRLSHDY